MRFNDRSMALLGIPDLPAEAFKHVGDHKIAPQGGGGSGGGGQAQPQQTTVQNTNVPEYARPYVETMLGTAQQQIYNYDKDASGNMVPTSMRGYTPYSQNPSDYFAPFSPLQNQAMGAAGQLGTSPELDMASNLAGAAGQRAMNMDYQAQNFGNQFQAPQEYLAQNFGNQFQAPQEYRAQNFGNQFQAPQEYLAQNFGNQFQAPQDYRTGQFNAQQVNAPQLQDLQMQGPADVNAPNLQQYQMGPAERVSTQDYTGQNVNKYMDPFMQDVVGVQQREAQRQADIAATQRAGQAVKSGAFGGSRAALLDAEAARNLALQKGDILATGRSAAFQNAQQQFNQQQQAALQAQQANQGAGLTVGQQNLASQLQTQGLGAGQNLQAQLANQGMGFNVGQQNLASRLQTQGLGSGQNLQAQLANQQQGMNAQQMREQSRQFGAGQGMTAAQQRAQYGLAGQQAGEQSRQFGAGQGMTAAQQRAQYGLAGQQAGEQSRQFGAGQGMTAAQQRAQYGLAGQQAGEQSRQFGAGQGMTAAQQRAQYGLAGQQAGEQSRQFGANLGLQGLQSGMQAAGQLGTLGQNRYAQQTGNIGLQNQLGAQQQAQAQRYIDQQIQNYGTAQQYPQQQLAFMSGLLRGLPLQTATTQQYQAAPSSLSQVAGLGLTGYGLSRMMKKGGKVKVPQRKAGLAELALSKMA